MPVAIDDLTFDTPQISDLVFEDTPSIDQLHFDNETTNVSQSIPQELTDKQEIDRLTERYRVAKSLTVDPVKLQRLDDEFKRKVAPLVDARPRTPGALATGARVNMDGIMGNYTQEMPIVVPQDVTTDEPIISEDAALKALKFLRRGSPIDNEYTRGAERSVAKMASGLTTSQGVMATAIAPFAPQLIASYFAVEGAKSFGEIAGQTSVDWNSLTPQEQGERAGDLLLSGAIPASLLIHSAMSAREGMAKINTPPVIPKDLPEQIKSIAPQTSEALKANLADLTPSEETKSAEPTKVEPTPMAEETEVAPAKPLETQSEALGEVEKRGAKEIKSELVSRLEDALDTAPNHADVVTEAKYATKANGKSYISTPAEDARTKITIDVPDDGRFEIWNTKEAIQSVLKKAKRIATNKTAPQSEYYTKRGLRGEITPEEGEVLPLSMGWKGAEIIGMGGAVPSEFAPSGHGPTSIKNARVDVERANRGLPPAIQPARRSFGQVWDEAMGLIDRDPDAQQRLLNELRENPRALTDQEDALLLHRQVDLQNEYAKATRDLAQAYDDGRMDAVGDEKARVASLSDQLLDIYNIGKKVGTETGRGLNARKMLANEDFTLATMEVQKRAANNGKPLTEQQSKEVLELNKKIADTQKAYDDYVAKTNERIAALETDKRIAEAKAVPQFHPGILKIAEDIVSKFEKSDMVKSARDRLKGRLLSPSPQDIADLAVIGATHIARGAIELAKFTEKMVGEFGENILPYIQEIHDKAKDLYDKFSDAEAKGQGPTVKRALNAKATIEERIEDAKTDLNASFEKQDKEAIHSQVNRIVRAMVEQEPNISRETLIDRVHEILKTMDPEITRLEAMDAISGRGIFSLPTQDKVSKTVRDLKQQVRLVGHQQDVIAKKPLPRTGPQRDAMSDAARHEQQKLNELKRQYGVVVTDPKKQLASALNARKTYYTHRIADLKAEIEKRERITKSRTAPPTDPALEALRAEYNRLKDEHNKIFGDRTLSDEQRLKLAEQAAKRSEDEWTKRLENAKTGKFGPTKEARPKLTSAAIEAIRARVEALKEQVKELQDLANPKKTPEEIALQSLKTRLKNRTAELLEKTARGDFSVKPRKPVVLDTEATRLHYENAQAKAAWYEGLIKDRLKNRSIPAKIIGIGAEILNTQRAIVTSLDLSAVLRQGGFIAFAHPIRALRAFPAMFRALRSAAGQHAVNQGLMLRPNFQLYRHSKLYLSLPEAGQTLAKMEEAYMSRWADKIPLVAGSQRAYVTFLNKLRADSFDAMASSLSRDGTLTAEEAKAVSNFINVATGRGNLGMKENALVGLNTVFFAPRYVASRFQLLAGQPFYKGTAATRLAIAKEYGRFLAGVAIIYGLANMDGAQIEQDPRSSDFGKLRYGNTRIDPMAGLIQTTVLVDRLAMGETKNSKGKIVPIRGDKVPFGSPNAADVIARFMRSKLAPAPGAVVDLLTGKNVVGEPVTVGSEAANIVVPLTASDIYKTLQEQGIPRGTAFALLSIFGVGLQNYEERKRTTR